MPALPGLNLIRGRVPPHFDIGTQTARVPNTGRDKTLIAWPPWTTLTSPDAPSQTSAVHYPLPTIYPTSQLPVSRPPAASVCSGCVKTFLTFMQSTPSFYFAIQIARSSLINHQSLKQKETFPEPIIAALPTNFANSFAASRHTNERLHPL